MSAFDNASKFFHACESLKGWAGCKEYVAPGTTFTAQSEPLTGVTTVEAYTEWMAGIGKGPLPGCRYELHSAAWDEKNRTALFFATFIGRLEKFTEIFLPPDIFFRVANMLSVLAALG